MREHSELLSSVRDDISETKVSSDIPHLDIWRGILYILAKFLF